MKKQTSKDLLETIENGIKDLINSPDFQERYKKVLEFNSKFHNYSINNLFLIFLQNPNASLVAGYKTWQNVHQRQVLKGEKGISILAPVPYKYNKELEVKNTKTGNVEKEIKEVEGLRFRRISVFDISQTNGKPIPTLLDELKGNSRYTDILINSLIDTSNTPIAFEPIKGEAKGYYSPSQDKIVIRDGMSKNQTVKTLIHEIAHSKMHSLDVINNDKTKVYNTRTKEVQAESVAYIVAKKYGIDTSLYTFGYLASWSSNLEFKELKTSFDFINKTANDIIKKVDKILLPIMTRDKIVDLYKMEFPAIKYIKPETAIKIFDLNRNTDKLNTIDNIKNKYKELGNLLVSGNTKSDKDFNELKFIVDDLKKCQLNYANETAKEMINTVEVTKNIDLCI